MEQIYYSLKSDPAFCAGVVADLIKADIKARDEGGWGEFERLKAQMAEIFQESIDRLIKEATCGISWKS